MVQQQLNNSEMIHPKETCINCTQSGALVKIWSISPFISFQWKRDERTELFHHPIPGIWRSATQKGFFISKLQTATIPIPSPFFSLFRRRCPFRIFGCCCFHAWMKWRRIDRRIVFNWMSSLPFNPSFSPRSLLHRCLANVWNLSPSLSFTLHFQLCYIYMRERGWNGCLTDWIDIGGIFSSSGNSFTHLLTLPFLRVDRRSEYQLISHHR